MILQLEFLGPYAAADITRKDAPEWPPHPDRVYQGLVDAATLSDPAEEAALLWLEAQPPPGLVVPDAVEMLPADTFVPVNYPDSGHDLEARSKQPRSFPMVWPRGPVRMVWPEPPADMLAPLARIAHRLTHVGRAESQVLATLTPGNEAAALVPHEDGRLSLRVPSAGRLAALELAFKTGRYALPARSVTYASSAGMVAAGPWSEIVSMRLRHPLSVVRVVEATEALRRAVLSVLGDSAPAAIHGHEGTGRASTTTHVAWLGLPNLSPFARGELIGLALALPADLPAHDRARCLQAVLAIDHIVVGGRRVEVEPPTHALSLEGRSWTRPARRWRSVTPVVLDRYPKRGKLTAEAIVQQGVVDAGFPEPVRVQLGDLGALGPSVPCAAFRLRRPGRIYRQVDIEFSSPVSGPVLVGAERHFGLGLCLPV